MTHVFKFPAVMHSTIAPCPSVTTPEEYENQIFQHITTLLLSATRVTTRPAFRGTVPKTYVKSCVQHFA
jgi:hypothetical protein